MTASGWVPDRDHVLVLDDDHWVKFMAVVPCERTDPADYDTCSIVGDHTHDTVLTWDRAAGTVIGLAMWHRTEGGWCTAGLYFANTPRPDGRTENSRGHTLEQLDPLHVEASLLCDCGHHGFIRDGRWIPA